MARWIKFPTGGSSQWWTVGAPNLNRRHSESGVSVGKLI